MLSLAVIIEISTGCTAASFLVDGRPWDEIGDLAIFDRMTHAIRDAVKAGVFSMEDLVSLLQDEEDRLRCVVDLDLAIGEIRSAISRGETLLSSVVELFPSDSHETGPVCGQCGDSVRSAKWVLRSSA